MKLYRKLSSLVVQYHNCIETNNTEWREKSQKEIESLVDYCSGNGIESVDFDKNKSNETLLLFYVSYHHMNEDGYYDGYTDHTIKVKPTFLGLDINISGANKNNIKAVLRDGFDSLLNEEITLNK